MRSQIVFNFPQIHAIAWISLFGILRCDYKVQRLSRMLTPFFCCVKYYLAEGGPLGFIQTHAYTHLHFKGSKHRNLFLLVRFYIDSPFWVTRRLSTVRENLDGICEFGLWSTAAIKDNQENLTKKSQRYLPHTLNFLGSFQLNLGMQCWMKTSPQFVAWGKVDQDVK